MFNQLFSMLSLCVAGDLYELQGVLVQTEDVNCEPLLLELLNQVLHVTYQCTFMQYLCYGFCPSGLTINNPFSDTVQPPPPPQLPLAPPTAVSKGIH